MTQNETGMTGLEDGAFSVLTGGGKRFEDQAEVEMPLFRQRVKESGSVNDAKSAAANRPARIAVAKGWEEDSERCSFSSRFESKQDVLFTRAKESAEIVQSYESMFQDREKSSMLLVTGPLGTGKTRIVKHALESRVRQTGGFFVTGKFDQLRRPEPFVGFVSAFTDFTNQVIERGPEAVKLIQDAVQESIGEEVSVLVGMIPALKSILPDGQEHIPTPKTINSIQRFVFVFRAFLKCVSSLKQPIVLLLDDLHFADHCSADLMVSIVSDLNNCSGLFVAATLDETGTEEDLAINVELRNVVQAIEKNGTARLTHITLQNLSEGEVNHFLGNMLELSDLHRAEELGAIVSLQTKGNLFFMVQLLSWLKESELLVFNIDRGSWDYDVEDIRMTLDVFKVGEFLYHKLEQQPVEMREILKVAACLGSCFRSELIEFVLDRPIEHVLAEAAENGILVHDSTKSGESKYHFEHDCVQQAVYSLIGDGNRDLFHLEIGRRLWRQLKADALDKHIFVLLSQMNIGRSLITRKKERYGVANLCLHAATKAAQSSAFRTALVYLNLGIDLLQASAWQDNYDLILAIYNAAAEMEMCVANFEAMEDHVEVILLNARRNDDKIQAHATQIYALGVSERQQEALDLGTEVLKGIGEHFPRILCRMHVMREMKAVRKLYKGKSNEQLLRLPSIVEREKLVAMQILNLMYLPAIMIHPKLSAFISLKMMKLTLTYGSCLISPVAFSSYGMLCVSCLRDIDSAFRFGELALDQMERLQAKEYLPRVYAAFYGCIYPWKKPVRSALEHLLHAYRVGMQSGDIEFACLNANIHCFMALQAGVPLDEIESTWTAFQKTMTSRRQHALLRMSLPTMQSIHHYMGLSSNPLASKGDLIDMDEYLKYSVDKNLLKNVKSINATRLIVAYVFNDLELAEAHAHALLHQLWQMPATIEAVLAAVICGLTALGVAAKGNKVRKNVALANRILKVVRYIARMSPLNFLDKKSLLEAELAATRGKDELAFECYTCAIALAHEQHFTFEQALANERTARFFLSREKPSDAEPYFRSACGLYCVWGGTAKVARLQAEIESLYGCLEAKPVSSSFTM